MRGVSGGCPAPGPGWPWGDGGRWPRGSVAAGLVPARRGTAGHCRYGMSCGCHCSRDRWDGEGRRGCGAVGSPCQRRDVPSAGLPARPVALLFEITHCGSGCFPGMAESWQLDRRFVLSPVLAEEGCNTCACDFHLSFHNSFSVAICVSLSASAVTHHRACYTGLCQG